MQEEATNAGDILLRQEIRETYVTWTTRRPDVCLFGARFESLKNRSRPLLVSSRYEKPGVTWMYRREHVNIVPPKLGQTEELCALSIVDLMTDIL